MTTQISHLEQERRCGPFGPSSEIPEISRSISRSRVLLRLEPVSVASKPLSGKPSLLPLLLCSCPPAVNRPKPSFSPARLSPPDDSDSSGQPEKLASFGMTYVPLLNVAQIFLGFRFKENRVVRNQTPILQQLQPRRVEIFAPVLKHLPPSEKREGGE